MADATDPAPSADPRPTPGRALAAVVAVLVAISVGVLGWRWWTARPTPHLTPTVHVVQPGEPVAGLDPADGVEAAGAPSGDALGDSDSVGATGATGAAGSTGAGSGGAAGTGSGGDPATLIVHVAGDVRRPGLVRLPPGSRVADAITVAGGLRFPRRFPGVNLARPVVDGEQILVQAAPPGGSSAAGAGSAGPPGAGADGGTGAGGTGAGPVNLNTATAEQLEGLPGIGPVTAAAILAWRQENGGFASVEELQEVSGIGSARLEQIADLVTVG